MKKIIIVLTLILPFTLHAQSIRFSVIADPQFSWMITDVKDITTKGTIAGINAGIGMDYYFAENYAFSTGISINNIGGKLQYPDSLDFSLSSGTVRVPPLNTISYKLQYINIPLGLKFKTNEIGYSTFFANLGVTPMINIRDRGSDVSGALYKDDISLDITSFNMNYFINMGVQYSIGGSTALIGGLGYSSGFMDVTTSEVDKVTINTLTIKLGILF